MNDRVAELEQRLVAGYQTQLQCYERALQLIAESSQATEPLAGGVPWVRLLNAVLSEANLLDATLKEDRAAWRAAGRRPGPELSVLLTRTAERMRLLSSRIDIWIEQMQARKQKLLPEMDAFIQGRRMLHAYGKSR